MARMNKSNALDMLSQTLDQFHKITGEYSGICCTWKGSLSVIGPPEFRDVIGNKTDEIWCSLNRQITPMTEIRSLKDERMCEQLTGDIQKYNKDTLRKLISWATQKSVDSPVSISNRSYNEQKNSTPVHPTQPSSINAIQLTSIAPINIRILQPSLTNKCLSELSTETMLSDNTIYAFCILLKNSFTNVNGLQDTILSQNQEFKKICQNFDNLQIHYNGASHWVCSYSNRSGEIFLYDSLYKGHITSYLQSQLDQLYGNGTSQLSVTVPTIQQQSGIYDCGLFALAVATSLAAGLDPVSQSWEQIKMRAHCRHCIQCEKITQFPGITKGRRTGKLPQPKKIKLNLF